MSHSSQLVPFLLVSSELGLEEGMEPAPLGRGNRQNVLHGGGQLALDESKPWNATSERYGQMKKSKRANHQDAQRG